MIKEKIKDNVLKILIISVPFILLAMIIWTVIIEHKKQQSINAKIESTNTLTTDTVIFIKSDKK